MTVTRPDADGRPMELMEVGPDERRELPSWARRTVAAVLAVAVAVPVGGDLLDRYQAHQLAQRQADTLALSTDGGGGGSSFQRVDLTVSLRNDGPQAVRLREPRLVAVGLDGIESVTAPETVAAGAVATVTATIGVDCPAPDLSATRVVISVTAVADSGRERRIELDVTTLPGLLEQACEVPSAADNLFVSVGQVSATRDALTVRLGVSTGAGGAGVLTEVSSTLFAVEVQNELPLLLSQAGTSELRLVLRRPDCDRVEPLPGPEGPGGLAGAGIRVPLDFVVHSAIDGSGAGSGNGPRPDGSQPDLEPGLVVGRDLGLEFPELAALAQQLTTRLCR